MSMFVIGDIHGMHQKFEQLWELAQPSIDDTVIMLGDYIDRGEDSKRVITSILKKKREGFKIIALMGNHEDMLLHYLAKQDIDLGDGEDPANYQIFLLNGGGATVKSYNALMPKTHLQFFMNTKLYHETDDFIFVHGGVKPNVPMKDQNQYDILWIREDFIFRKPNLNKTVIFGHTPTTGINGCGDQPYFGVEKIGLDTGCVFGGKLTGMWLPSQEFVQV